MKYENFKNEVYLVRKCQRCASGPKTYDYLCSFDAKPDDQVVAASNGKPRFVQVRKVTTVFEDELPLPLAKMSWVEKPD